jgi:hypothetical protein
LVPAVLFTSCDVKCNAFSLSQLFIAPLHEASKTSAPILTARQIADVFSNLDDIITVNQELFEQLSARLREPTWTAKNHSVGDIFVRLSPFLKVYAVYVRNYQQAIRFIMEQMSKHTQFAQFLVVRRGCGLV